MNRFKEKFMQFMYGRYGIDTLGKWTVGLGLAIMLIAGWTSNSKLSLLSWVLIIYSYYRMFSRNISKRYAENQKYLNYRYQMAVKWNRFKKHLAQRKNYRFYKCPQCKQKVRVPKGRGKICITCPKCRTEFVKKS